MPVGTMLVLFLVTPAFAVSTEQSRRVLGAELVVEDHDPTWSAAVRAWMPGGVDVAMAVQPGTAVDSVPVVKDGELVIAVSGYANAPERGVGVEIEHVYNFEDVLAALAKSPGRRARGKSVLWISQPATKSVPLTR